MTVDIICPKYGHSNIRKKNHVQRAGAVIGAGVGAAAGWADSAQERKRAQ